MFFIRACRILAIGALVFGGYQILIGLLIATEVVGPYELALKRYTPTSSSGEVIDRGTYNVVVAVVLGTLAEIGSFVAKASNK